MKSFHIIIVSVVFVLGTQFTQGTAQAQLREPGWEVHVVAQSQDYGPGVDCLEWNSGFEDDPMVLSMLIDEARIRIQALEDGTTYKACTSESAIRYHLKVERIR